MLMYLSTGADNRRLRSIILSLNYSYLLIAKKNMIDANFFDIKETILKDYKKIK